MTKRGLTFQFFPAIVGMLLGSVLGAVAGLALGGLMARGYHVSGPTDPADAPVYVALGLAMIGAAAGATFGSLLAILGYKRLTRRQAPNRAF